MGRKSIKRENGTGSVYMRKDKKRKKWVATAPGIWENGRYKQMVIGNFETAKEAKDALYQYNLSPSDKYNITVEEAFEEWSQIAYRNISKQTQDNYNAAFQKIEPVKRMKLRELRTSHMQHIIDANANLSRSSLSKIKVVLSKIMDYGMENDIVNKNYANYIVLPRSEASVKDCFSDIELQKIENAVNLVPFADLILAMCYTGFRISEFLELTPFSYDRENGTLTGGKKTEAGKNRIVPIHPKIFPIVERWVKKGGQTIFCQENGKPYGVKQFRDKYYVALDSVGVRKFPPHATRHTFATKLAAAGARPEDIQKILGHAKYDVTANVYIHQATETLKNAVNLVP